MSSLVSSVQSTQHSTDAKRPKHIHMVLRKNASPYHQNMLPNIWLLGSRS